MHSLRNCSIYFCLTSVLYHSQPLSPSLLLSVHPHEWLENSGWSNQISVWSYCCFSWYEMFCNGKHIFVYNCLSWIFFFRREANFHCACKNYRGMRKLILPTFARSLSSLSISVFSISETYFAGPSPNTRYMLKTVHHYDVTL